MQHRITGLALLMVLSCMVLGNGIACAPGAPQTRCSLAMAVGVGGIIAAGEGTASSRSTCSVTSMAVTWFHNEEVIQVMAIPDEGFQFLKWRGDVSTIGDVSAATTTITMSGNYTIVATFAKEIRDWHDLNAMRVSNCVHYYVLMNDLDSTTAGYEALAGPNANGGKGWEPLGTVATGVAPMPWQWYYPFTGTLDGQGHEVRDLFIDRPDEPYVGLFGYMRGSDVTDIGVVNASVTGLYCVGSLVGWNEDGTVNNSYAAGTVNGNGRVGGLVGDNWGLVSNCYATTAVAGESSVGGLVGYDEGGTVSSSFWDIEISGQATSAGGTGKTTAEMTDIATFTDTDTEGLDDPWDIIAVANPGERNAAYIWNIVDGVTYPFLSWEP